MVFWIWVWVGDSEPPTAVYQHEVWCYDSTTWLVTSGELLFMQCELVVWHLKKDSFSQIWSLKHYFFFHCCLPSELWKKKKKVKAYPWGSWWLLKLRLILWWSTQFEMNDMYAKSCLSFWPVNFQSWSLAIHISEILTSFAINAKHDCHTALLSELCTLEVVKSKYINIHKLFYVLAEFSVHWHPNCAV